MLLVTATGCLETYQDAPSLTVSAMTASDPESVQNESVIRVGLEQELVEVFGITEKQRLRDKQLENALADAMENPDLSEADKAEVGRQIAFKRAQIKPIPQLRTPTAQERFDKDRVVDETGQRHILQSDGTFKPVPRDAPKVTPEVTAGAYETAYKILSQDGVVPTEKAIDALVGKILGVQGGGAQGAQQPGAVSPVAQSGQPQAAAIVDGEVNALAEELRIQPAEARQILAKRDAGRASQPTRPQAATPAQQAAQAIERGPAEALLDQQQGGVLSRGQSAAGEELVFAQEDRAAEPARQPSGIPRTPAQVREDKVAFMDKLRGQISGEGNNGRDGKRFLDMEQAERLELVNLLNKTEDEIEADDARARQSAGVPDPLAGVPEAGAAKGAGRFTEGAGVAAESDEITKKVAAKEKLSKRLAGMKRDEKVRKPSFNEAMASAMGAGTSKSSFGGLEDKIAKIDKEVEALRAEPANQSYEQLLSTRDDLVHGTDLGITALKDKRLVVEDAIKRSKKGRRRVHGKLRKALDAQLKGIEADLKKARAGTDHMSFAALTTSWKEAVKDLEQAKGGVGPFSRIHVVQKEVDRLAEAIRQREAKREDYDSRIEARKIKQGF